MGISTTMAQSVALVSLVACASGDPEIATRGSLTASVPCAHVRNIDFSSDTTFPSVVAFRAAAPELAAGDSITITEVRGTRDHLEVGGIYLVRGQYTLSSADAADLALNVSATEPGEGCTVGNPRGMQRITRGTGTFELATRMVYAGKPHVWIDGLSRSGVYFEDAP